MNLLNGPLHWIGGLGLDLRLGLRMLRRSWGLTLVGGLAMAVTIGIGAITFAVVDAYQGNTLPLPEGDRVVRLTAIGRDRGFASSQDFEWWRKGMQSVVDISAFRTMERLLLNEDGSSKRISVAAMSASGFRVARVRPLAGRPLLEDDERTGAPPVVVIGYDVWQSRFSGDRAAVGQTVRLGGADHTVVGIMPRDFAFPLNQKAWIPLRLNPVSQAQSASAVMVSEGWRPA